MQLRGTTHVLLTDSEIMKRIHRRDCVDVLRQLMWFYETHSRRKLFEDQNRGYEHGLVGMEGVLALELEGFVKLMGLTGKWLSQPVIVDFGGNDPGVKLSKAERRRRRRDKRKQQELF